MIDNGITAAAGRDEFLQLLTTQLRHQDPLDPIDQQDFVAQLAQFSTLEGIEQLNASFSDMLKLQELTQGASLIGRRAVYQPIGQPLPVEGLVEGVRLQGGSLAAVINGESVSIDQILQLSL